MAEKIKVTVWHEFRHEKSNEAVKKVYPDGIHMTIKSFLDKCPDLEVKTATLDEPEHGLTDDVLANTDVMLWWGHCAHGDVKDEIAEKVQKRVLEGMGLIVLHSGHFSKPFKKLMGTHCSLKWREIAERERLWCIEPSHPIAAGVPEQVVIPNVEMYGERFDIPTPDKVVFIGWFEGGEVFRSGCTFQRGHGKIFYFQPGHETFPIYHQAEIQKIITNAVHWAKPTVTIPFSCPNVPQPWEECEEKEGDFGKAGILQDK